MPDSVTNTFTDTQSNPNRVRESLVRGKSGRVPSKRYQRACAACLVNWLLLLGQPRTVLGAVNTSTVFSHRFKRTLNQRAARYSSPVTWTITSRTTCLVRDAISRLPIASRECYHYTNQAVKANPSPTPQILFKSSPKFCRLNFIRILDLYVSGT